MTGGGEISSGNDEVSPVETVTITISAPETESGTKVLLADDTRVEWQEGDYVIINGSPYTVTPDPDDPTKATIEGVIANDEYYATYGSSGLNWSNGKPVEGYVYMNTYRSYVEGSFDGYNLPMVAYSTGTDLQFKNLAGAVRLGVSGIEGLRYLYLVSNNGVTMTGRIILDLEDVRNGNFGDTFAEFEFPDRNYICTEHDEYLQPFPSTPADPAYFYMVVPAQIYTGGFTVYMEDSNGKVGIKSTSSAVTVRRSSLVPMETFKFEALPVPVISDVTATAEGISAKVTAEPGMQVRVGLVYKNLYDQMSDYRKNVYAREALWNEPQTGTANSSGVFQTVVSKAYNDADELCTITGSTEYYIVASYGVVEENPIGDPVVYAVTSAAGIGTAPTLNIAVDERSPYVDVVLNVNAENAAGVQVCRWMKAEYDALVTAGMSDQDIALAYGQTLDEEELTAALSGGFDFVGYDNIYYEGFDYVFLAAAIGDGGMVTVKKEIYQSPSLSIDTQTWTQLDGTTTMHLYVSSAAATISGATVEINADGTMYRISADAASDFSALMEDIGYELDNDSPEICVYVYVSDVVTEWGSAWRSGCITTDSRLGFTANALPLTMLSNNVNSMWQDPAQLHINVYGTIYPVDAEGIQLIEDHDYFQINVDVNMEGETEPGLTNESYVINKVTAW